MAANFSKRQRMQPLIRVCASERAKQYPDDLYSDGDVLFCRFCQHSVDFVRIHTIKDHLASKKHLAHKTAKTQSKIATHSKQVTLTTMVQSKDQREEFVLDFVKMLTVADIPLEKVDKMKPFIMKYCRQGGALLRSPTMRQLYIPKLFEEHITALKALVQGVSVAIVADETTDARDHSILNVVACVRGKSYLIDVATMQACNHGTLSQAILQAVTGMGIQFDDVAAVVTDSAAYCKKAFREVLTPVFPNATHILCLAHVLNLVGDVFQKWGDFGRTATLVSMVKSAFFKKPGRKSRYLEFLSAYLPKDQVKLPPVPCTTRWNTWFKAVLYHACHIHMYQGFFKVEASQGMAVESIIEMTGHATIYPELQLHLSFLAENCPHLMNSLTSLEATQDPLAVVVYNTLQHQRHYLQAGTTKASFGVETDRLLTQLKDADNMDKAKVVKSFHGVYRKALAKLESHVDNHPAMLQYKAARIFDPRQLPTVSRHIADYEVLRGLKSPSPMLVDEWVVYTQYRPEDIPEPLDLPSYWESMSQRFPNLAAVAKEVIWIPVASVDVERSFSQYKHLLNDRRESLSEANTKRLVMLYYNGDIEQRFAV